MPLAIEPFTKGSKVHLYKISLTKVHKLIKVLSYKAAVVIYVVKRVANRQKRTCRSAWAIRGPRGIYCSSVDAGTALSKNRGIYCS